MAICMVPGPFRRLGLDFVQDVGSGGRIPSSSPDSTAASETRAPVKMGTWLPASWDLGWGIVFPFGCGQGVVGAGGGSGLGLGLWLATPERRMAMLTWTSVERRKTPYHDETVGINGIMGLSHAVLKSQ